MNKTKIIR